MSKIQIAIAYHKNSEIIKNNCLLPLQVGKACSDIDLDMQGDNTGDNISDKNFGYAELTAIYWLWKNSNADIKGLCHYRRYLDLNKSSEHTEDNVYEYPLTDAFSSDVFLKQMDISEKNITDLLKKYTILTRKREDLYSWSRYSVKSHYAAEHHGEHLEKALEIIKTDYPEYYSSARKLVDGHTSYFTNVFIMKSEQYNEYCSWMFDILFKIEKTLNLYDKTLAPNTKKARWAGFLGERLTAIYIQKQIDDGKKVGEFPAVILTPKDKKWNECNTYDSNLYVRNQVENVVIENTENKKNPILSVCVAAYNVDRFIDKCLSSVIEQTLQNIEIIVVNDGSKDNTLNIIQDFARKDKRIVIVDKENAGLGNARNSAIEIAKGKYIHLMDADDYMDKTFLENMVKNAEKYNSDMVISTHRGVEEQTLDTLFVSTLPHTLLKDKINVKNNIDLLLAPCHVWDKIYKKSLIKDIPFTAEGGEDIYFWYRTALKAKSVSIHRTCEYNYRINTKSVQSNPKYALGVFKNIERSEQLIQSTNNKDIIDMFNLFKMVLVGHVMYRAHDLIALNADFRKQFFKNIKCVLDIDEISDNIENKKEWYWCDFNLIKKVMKCKSIKDFDRLVVDRPIRDIIVNRLKLMFSPKRKKEKYRSRIREAFYKLHFPIRFKMFGVTVSKITKDNNKYKFYFCRIPLFKKNTINKTIKFYVLGLPIYSKNKIKTKFLGITTKNKTEDYLIDKFDYIGYVLNSLKDDTVCQKLSNNVQEIADNIENFESKSFEKFDYIGWKVNEITNENMPIEYANEFEKGFIKKYFNDFDISGNKKDVEKLLSGLDAKSAYNIQLVLSRIKRLIDNNYNNMDIFSKEECDDIINNNKQKQNIIRLDDNLFYHKNCYLPLNHFEEIIFEQKINIGLFPDNVLSSLKDKSIVDVGAYVGDSVFVLNQLKPKHIYAFEANPKNYDMLKQTIKLNNLSNVIPENTALGDKVNGKIFISDDEACSSISNADGSNMIACKMTTLDDYVEKHPDMEVNLIKVDIEGAEQSFLKGAIKTLKKHKPVLIMSIYHNWSDFLHIKTWLEDLNLGYKFIVSRPIAGAIVLETQLLAYPESKD